MKGCDVELKVT